MKLNRMVAISENGFVFDASTGDSYSLNPIAIEIVEMIKNGKSKEEIQNHIQHNYEVSGSTLEKSLDDFYSSLNSFKITEN